MQHEGVENLARVPESAAPHWEGNGWKRTDPPPRRTYHRPQAVDSRTAQAAATETPNQTATEPAVDDTPKTTKAAPVGRKGKD